jgi:glycosyltransferase involved in cell wall biosynthesis
MKKQKISIVLPLFNERESLSELYQGIKNVMQRDKYNYEIIFVDDGSNDGSFNVLEEFRRRDKKVKVISFQGNYGKATALQAGFDFASGEIIVTMDSDLQDNPEEIPHLVEIINRGYDFVNGWKYRKWQGNLIFSILSWFYNWISGLITGVKFHDFNCPFKAYRAEVAKKLNLYGSLHRYIPALAAWQGVKFCETKVSNRPRKYGESKYSIWKMRGFFDLITVKFLSRFSAKPLHLFGSMGFLSSFIGFVICFALLIRWIIGYSLANNMPLLLLGILLLVVGIQLISLGLLAEMIARTRREKPEIKRILK